MNATPYTIRVSLASTSILDLKKLKYEFEIKTVYLLTPGKCLFDCKYCTQAKSSKSPKNYLSRVVWPEYDLDLVLEKILEKREKIERVCLQTVNNSTTRKVIFKILNIIGKELKVSISINSENLNYIKELFNLNVDRVGLPIDVANENLYRTIRGGSFKRKLNFILKCSQVFKGKISTHIIVGLGESDKDILTLYENFIKNGVTVALFSFTPIIGTQLESYPPPSLLRYRKIQIATKLLEEGFKIYDFEFDSDGNIKNLPKISYEDLIKLNPFLTRGCQFCSRPFYNERPKGELYNYPFQLSQKDFEKEYYSLKRSGIL